MRLALVHDCIIHVGGAERFLQHLHAIFPEAPIFTVVCDRGVARTMFPDADIRCSFVQSLPGASRFFRAYSPFFPMAVESLDLSGFDVILSSSFAFAKGALAPPSACHICYCHTPLRYLWSEYHFHRATVFRRPLRRLMVDPILSYLRVWDRVSADRVDYFVANSEATAARVAKYYRRDCCIIYSPVEVGSIPLSRSSDDYFLLVSRLMPYKRVDIAIAAFGQLGLPLKIVGAGPGLAELRRRAKANVEFLGTVPAQTLEHLYARCRAFVFPAVEDFGRVMVEAQAYGKPVIALAGGGALEIVANGRTGVLFAEQTPEALMDAVKRFATLKFDPAVVREQVLRFDESEFRRNICAFVEEKRREGSTRGRSRVWTSRAAIEV